MGNPKRIRSNYQRRVLDWLTDGGGTVSDVARALNLRMPHASAALKQLRESGDVVRDEENIRGSYYRVTSQGLSRIEADELYRLISSVQWPPPARSCRNRTQQRWLFAVTWLRIKTFWTTPWTTR